MEKLFINGEGGALFSENFGNNIEIESEETRKRIAEMVLRENIKTLDWLGPQAPLVTKYFEWLEPIEVTDCYIRFKILRGGDK